MKARLFQLDVTPGHPVENTSKIVAAIEAAKKEAVDLIVFPEMSVPGYLLGDEWERLSFLRECERCTHKITSASQGICVVFGNVAVDWSEKNEDGRVRKYNALFVAENTKLIINPATGFSFFIKILMPNYREFDDNRHFYDPRKLAYEREMDIRDLIQPALTSLGALGCILCEDGWDDDYNLSPITELSQKQVTLFINISSSPYTFNKNQKRHRVFSRQANQYKTPLLYVNNTGLQDNAKTVFTFDGSSRAYDANGQICSRVALFEESFCDATFFENTHAHALHPSEQEDTTQSQFKALQYGIKTFMQRISLKKVVVGVSGGIDSALVASLLRTFMPAENLLLVSMPGPFTSKTTLELAKKLAENLDCGFTEIPIDQSVELTKMQITDARFTRSSGCIKLPVSDFVLENIQARDRSSRVLAAVAAAFGGAFTCNANKSEMTIGYSTLYGDLGGFLAPISDLWKGEVYAMAQYINQSVFKREVIPIGTINIIPSAELSNTQNVDEGQGDPLHYPYHDALFASWVEFWDRATPEENLEWYLDGVLEERLGFSGKVAALFPTPQAFIEDLERWWRLYQGMAIAKRIQAPPILAIKRRAFGFDHRESQLGPRFTEKYQEYKRIALGE